MLAMPVRRRPCSMLCTLVVLLAGLPGAASAQCAGRRAQGLAPEHLSQRAADAPGDEAAALRERGC
jgi:hypothetical protein